MTTPVVRTLVLAATAALLLAGSLAYDHQGQQALSAATAAYEGHP